jgi:DNA mismatch repair protein MutS2
MGLDPAIVERANELLAREDRQLDRVLAELTSSRAALEAEERDIARVRIETEALRDEHRRKLERLQERRDKLFAEMRDELEQSFRNAHENIAEVIRNLQRGGTARHAARAREQIQSIAAAAKEQQREAGLSDAGEAALPELDWSTIQVGDPVQVAPGGRAVLLAVPDRRGRVAVRLGSARVLVPRDRVGAAPGGAKRQPGSVVRVTSPTPAVPSDAAFDAAGHCDLRGLRVDEALDRLVAALDRAISADRSSLAVIHGLGTGTLRKAVREHLRASTYVADYAAAAREEGGEGVTIAMLR